MTKQEADREALARVRRVLADYAKDGKLLDSVRFMGIPLSQLDTKEDLQGLVVWLVKNADIIANMVPDKRQSTR